MGKKLIIALVALIGCWTAAAQESAMTPNSPAGLSAPVSIPPIPPAPATATISTPVPVAPVPLIHIQTKQPVPVAAKSLTVTLGRNGGSRPSAIDSMYDFVETPFASSVRVPMASVAGGRLQLSGFHCLASSENFQLGLPGGGVLPAWGIGLQSHAVILVPQNNESGGFNVTFTFRANESGALHLRTLSAVNHAVIFLRRI